MEHDFCDVCAGVQSPDHKHTCGFCGRDAGRAALAVGDDGTRADPNVPDNEFFCDVYCLNAAKNVAMPRDEQDRHDVVTAARLLKRKAEELGVNWGTI